MNWRPRKSSASTALMGPVRARWPLWLGTVLIPILLAACFGWAVVVAPSLTLIVVAAGGFLLALLLRVEWAVLAFVALAPFDDYAQAVHGSTVKLLGALLVLSWLLHLLTENRTIRLRSPVVYAGVALFAALLASTMLHSNGAAGVETLIRYVSYISVLIILIDCMRAGRLAPVTVIRVYVVACVAAAGCALIVFFAQDKLRVSGPIADPNDFGFYMVSALPLAMALAQTSQHRWRYGLGIALLLLATAGTLSRGAGAALLAMAFFAVATRLVRIRTMVLLSTAVAVVSVGVMVFIPDRVGLSVAAKSQVAVANVESRIDRWQAATEMTADHPILGVGPAGFERNYDRYIDHLSKDPLHPLDVSHNTYLEVSSELGLLGLGCFLAVLIFGYRGARRRWRGAMTHVPTERWPSGSSSAPAIVAGAVCTSFVGVLVAATFITEHYFLPLWLLAALGAVLDPGELRSRPRVLSRS